MRYAASDHQILKILCIFNKNKLYTVLIELENSYGGPLGYIMKDERRKKFKIDKGGIPGHPKVGSTLPAGPR